MACLVILLAVIDGPFLEDMDKFGEELVKAGVVLAFDGLQPR